MKFEHITILKGNLNEQEKNEEINKIKDYCKSKKIEIKEFEDIGLKKLAYEIKNNKEGIYIKLVLDTKKANIPDFEKYLKEDNNVIKFLTIQMEETINKELNIYDEIKQLGESNLFNAIADEVIYQIENNEIENIEINLENVKNIVDNVLEDDLFNENMNNCVKYAIDNKIKEQDRIEEQEEEN